MIMMMILMMIIMVLIMIYGDVLNNSRFSYKIVSKPAQKLESDLIFRRQNDYDDDFNDDNYDVDMVY